MKQRTDSILQTEKKCFITGSYNVCLHHCICGTANRKKCDEWGLWVWLNPEVHHALHTTKPSLRSALQRKAQEAFEKLYGHEKFMEVFHKNYL